MPAVRPGEFIGGLVPGPCAPALFNCETPRISIRLFKNVAYRDINEELER